MFVCLFVFINLIGGELLYNPVLVSAIHQHESATGIHMSPPSWPSLLPPTTSHLISFRMDWLDLFAVQGTLKSLLQHHSSQSYLISL